MSRALALEGPLPFLFNFLNLPSRAEFTESISGHEKVAESYCPKTQLSDHTVWAGTSKTYRTTYSGLWGGNDDAKVNDG